MMLRVTPSGSRKGFLICYEHHNSLVKYTLFNKCEQVL